MSGAGELDDSRQGRFDVLAIVNVVFEEQVTTILAFRCLSITIFVLEKGGNSRATAAFRGCEAWYCMAQTWQVQVHRCVNLHV